MVTFTASRDSGLYHWNNNKGQLRMPNGRVHDIKITAEPGLCQVTEFIVDGSPSPIPHMFKGSDSVPLRKNLQASVRRFQINTKLVAPGVQSLWNSTMAKQTWLSTDIAFITTIVYTVAGGVKSSVKDRALLSQLVSAYLVSSLQTILVKNILENNFGFHTGTGQKGGSDSFVDSETDDDDEYPYADSSDNDRPPPYQATSTRHGYATRSRGESLLVAPLADEYSEAQLIAYKNHLASLLNPGIPAEPAAPSAVQLQQQLQLAELQAQVQSLQDLVMTLSATQTSMHGLLHTTSSEIRRMFALLNTGMSTTMSSMSLTHPRGFQLYKVFYPVIFGMAMYGALAPLTYVGQDHTIFSTNPDYDGLSLNTNNLTLSTLVRHTSGNESNPISLHAWELLSVLNSATPLLARFPLYSEDLTWNQIPHDLLQRVFQRTLGNPSLSIRSRLNYVAFHMGSHAMLASILLTVARPYRLPIAINVGLDLITFAFWIIAFYMFYTTDEANSQG